VRRTIATLSLLLVLAVGLSAYGVQRSAGARVMSASYASTAAITGDDLSSVTSSGSKLVCYVYSTQAGTVIVRYIDDVWVARDLTASLVVAATTLTVISFTYHVPRSRLVFTPDAATAGTVTADCYTY